jgi:diguanylate cyclase (GGDEF)-like protein
MAIADPPNHGVSGNEQAAEIGRALADARARYYEDPQAVLAEAVRCHEAARLAGNSGLCARALVLQSFVSLHRGDLRSALSLAVEAERRSESGNDLTARCEVAALRAQLSFFTGSYAEALRHSDLSVELSDKSADVELQIFARRAACLVCGNVGVRNWRERLDELLAMTISSGNRWDEAISRNDLACYHLELGDVAAAEQEIGRALDVAHGLESSNSFVLAVVCTTRADIRLAAGRPADALADAERGIALLIADDEPSPYVLGMAVRAEVQARMALGQVVDAQLAGEGALGWLGDRVPQTRSVILSTLAGALREAGRIEEAYDALERASALERQAFRELSELQLALERARLEAELLRDQANRDWLTGLHNRRYLEAELVRLAEDRRRKPVSLAVLDLDHFKSINDRFGHDTGDQVLVRVARLLREALRDADTIVRSGGEEFIFLMPDTDGGAATACSERIRRQIAEEPWGRIVPGLTVTSSVGVACTVDPNEVRALLAAADERLYEAKHAGRDVVVGAPEARLPPLRLLDGEAAGGDDLSAAPDLHRLDSIG